MNIRLQYNEKMLKLQNKYGVTSEEVHEIENDSHMDDVSESILNQAISELDTRAMESHENITV